MQKEKWKKKEEEANKKKHFSAFFFKGQISVHRRFGGDGRVAYRLDACVQHARA